MGRGRARSCLLYTSMLKRILQEGHDRGELVVPDINSTAYLLLKSFKSLEAPYINRYHHEYGKEDYLRIIAAMKQLLRQGLTNHGSPVSRFVNVTLYVSSTLEIAH